MAKATKSEAAYRDHANGHDRCARCAMFRPPQGCTAVMGTISPQGWCEYFAEAERHERLVEALSRS